MIRAAFFDVDGTLFSHTTKRMPPSTRDALEKLRAEGILCVVSTGRMIREMDKLPMAGISFDAYITMNGQLTLDENRNPLYGMPVTGALKEFVLKLFHERKLPVIFVEQDRLYLNYSCEKVEAVQAAISSKVPPVAEYEGATVYQVCVYLTEEEETLLKPVNGIGEITRWHFGGVDIIAKGGGKRTAIEKYLELYDLKPEEIIAFGDGENDMGMLQLAGIGIAMGNAEPKVKEIADYVTADIDDDGLAKALKHFGLIE